MVSLVQFAMLLGPVGYVAEWQNLSLYYKVATYSSLRGSQLLSQLHHSSFLLHCCQRSSSADHCNYQTKHQQAPGLPAEALLPNNTFGCLSERECFIGDPRWAACMITKTHICAQDTKPDIDSPQACLQHPYGALPHIRRPFTCPCLH